MKKLESQSDAFYNADVFKVLVDYELARSKRYPSPVALIEFEVKYVSSQESALKSAPMVFLTALSKHLRSVDIPSQTGSTFKALLPTTDENGVRAVCERLLSVFKNKFNSPDGSSIAFSLQIGASSHPGGPTLASEELFSKVSEALKQSKAKGPSTYVIL